ncbi:unnamed protein product, partial (macronuclear) [Paramecium tetraurelia]
MIVGLYFVSIIVGVFGWREYYREYPNIYGYYTQKCPELHAQKVGMHPHQCVCNLKGVILAYALICKGVTEIIIKTELNGTQHLCHPKFQPWGAGTPTRDNTTLHCGFDGGDQLVMEMLADGNYQYYCKSLTDDKNIRCLITASQYGIYSCQFCKPPYYGLDCKKVLWYFDYRFTNPPRQCLGNCQECEDSVSCYKCLPGKANANNDKMCSLGRSQFKLLLQIVQDLQIALQLLIHINLVMFALRELYLDRTVAFVYFKQQFIECPDGCLTCTQDQQNMNKRSCDVCDSNYFRLLYSRNEPDMYYCYRANNCDTSRQSLISQTVLNTGEYVYNIRCYLCDPGLIYVVSSEQCQGRINEYISLAISTVKQGCFFFGTNQGTNCVACSPWYSLQSDGTCKPMACNQECFTCLDTNPDFCTTCDGFNHKIPDNNGICICKPNYGLKADECVKCSEGYCQECEVGNFFLCTSCAPEKYRILIDQQCVCQPGFCQPADGSATCILCDKSCVNCSGPTINDCTLCPDEMTTNRIQIGNSCPCKKGYAEYEVKDAKCGKCHPRCKSCLQAADETSNQYCLTCIPGQNRILSENLNCDCKDNYSDFDGTLDICIICDYTCGVCNDFGPTHCTSCLESSHRYLTGLGECLCKTSYFDDQIQNTECQKCHYSCLRCANSIEQNTCVECPPTRMPSDPLATQFQCICEFSNFFDDGLLPTCLQCDASCLTCNGPLSSNCLSCDSTYREFYLSSCLCPPGQFDVGQLECAKCHYSCFQCFDNTAEGCINCSIDFHLRVLKGNTCKCIDGYYDEPGSSKCKKCSYKCETCEEQAEKCLSCPLNQLRTFDSTTGCLCPGEYYDQQNVIICQKCHFKCKNCSAQTESSCLSCDPLSYREIKLQQCKCQPHYFEMEVQECASNYYAQLQFCSALCYECVDRLDNCTSCYDDRYLIGNKCQCASKFQGASISTFEFNGMCHYSCATCGGKEEIDCISCIDTDNRYQVGNTCVCKEGYYDAGLPVCQKCSYKCKGCSKQSEYCTSCQDNSLRQLVSDFKTCKCNQRYYDDGQNEVCQQCHYSCLRCNDIDTKCELCSFESNRIYNDQLFSCDCDVGYYNTGVEICQKCHYSCLNCNSGYSSSCIQCVDSNISNRVFYNNTCKCLFGYFDDGQSIKCQKCDVQCLSCINQSYQCLSCPQTRKLETNCKCQQGYYDIGLQLCQKCNSICSACEFTSNNCTQCDSDQFRELNEITKTCDCQIGYLELNGICQQCDQSCKICQQQLNHCTSCVQFRKLNNNNCICIDGMFESIQDKQCKLCHKTCLTCAYSDQYCLTCSVDNFRIFKSGNTCECIQGYYENQITYACEQCSKSCLTCSQQYNNCLTCDTTLNLSLINNQCLCSQSYYFNSLTNSCQQCNITCLDCQIQNECTSCKLTTRHLDQDQKKCICNDGYYETNQANCQQCHLSCETCINID